MFPFITKTDDEDISSQDKIIWRLLDTPLYDRRRVLMTALQMGEIRLSQASDVLLAVDRIEALAKPMRPRYMPFISPDEPYWQQQGRRYIFADAA